MQAQAQHTRKRQGAPRVALPAFGRELLELRKKGLVPSPAQCGVCLDFWKWNRSIRHRVVVPPDASPTELDFSIVAGLDVVVYFSLRISAIKRRDELLRALVKANPLRIHALDMDSPADSFFVKSVAVGVERPEYA